MRPRAGLLLIPALGVAGASALAGAGLSPIWSNVSKVALVCETPDLSATDAARFRSDALADASRGTGYEVQSADADALPARRDTAIVTLTVRAEGPESVLTAAVAPSLIVDDAQAPMTGRPIRYGSGDPAAAREAIGRSLDSILPWRFGQSPADERLM